MDNLEFGQLERIVFCGDGGSWIWNGAEKLCERMGFDENKIFQGLDYTHAKQNLRDIIDLVCPTKQAVTTKKWKDLLWNGQMDSLEACIKALVTNKKKLTQALKKFTNYTLQLIGRECSTRNSERKACLVAAVRWKALYAG